MYPVEDMKMGYLWQAFVYSTFFLGPLRREREREENNALLDIFTGEILGLLYITFRLFSSKVLEWWSCFFFSHILV